MLRFFPLFLVLPWLLQCQTAVAPKSKLSTVTPENFRVAYVGDIGAGDESHKVLELIRSENSGLFVLLGDFDYKDDPEYFGRMLDETIREIPLFAVVGNHDKKRWDGYRKILEKRLKAIPDVHCRGEIGIKMRCEYKGLVFALSGIGVMGLNHEGFLAQALQEAEAPFKICAWHKNQAAMQAGMKRDETGWEAYEICRQEGAMIATGHEHSYSRTYLLSHFEKKTVASRDSELVLDRGRSFAFVSGLGGQSIRGQRPPHWIRRTLGQLQNETPEKATDPWWAKVYTADQKARPAVLFCDYFVDQDPRKARCFLKNIDGEIVESFTIRSRI